MGSSDEEFWSVFPDKALHPLRVPVIEALWRIEEPLSSVELVDVLDGFLSMWEAAYHLGVLKTLNVVEVDSTGASGERSKHGLFGMRYRLKGCDGCD